MREDFDPEHDTFMVLDRHIPTLRLSKGDGVMLRRVGPGRRPKVGAVVLAEVGFRLGFYYLRRIPGGALYLVDAEADTSEACYRHDGFTVIAFSLYSVHHFDRGERGLSGLEPVVGGHVA